MELFDTFDDADVSPGPYTALLVESGGSGASIWLLIGVLSTSVDGSVLMVGLGTTVFSDGGEKDVDAGFSLDELPNNENGDFVDGCCPKGLCTGGLEPKIEDGAEVSILDGAPNREGAGAWDSGFSCCETTPNGEGAGCLVSGLPNAEGAPNREGVGCLFSGFSC